MSMNLVLFHNERDAPCLADEPLVMPGPWLVVEGPEGTWHLAAVMASQSLRLTSAISAVDRRTRTVITASGRVYRLEGPPADGDTAVLLLVRAGLGAGSGVEDVTQKLLNLWEPCLDDSE